MPILLVLLALSAVAVTANLSSDGNPPTPGDPSATQAITSIGTDLVIVAVVIGGVYIASRFLK